MPDKLLVRVLQAIEAGCATSIEVHQRIEPPVCRASISNALAELMGCGCLTRERVSHGRGRPHYRYRIIVKSRGFVAS